MSTSTSASPSTKSHSPHILVVDDEQVIRDICKRSLEPLGYQVSTAENGFKAQEIVRQKDIEAVFTDFKMPMMDGIELLECIKRDRPHIEVVILTAYATIEHAIHAMKIGAYDFILKPVKPEQLRLVAAKCFDKIRLSEENRTLRLMNEKLTELQEMKDKFIAITSHELRTPLSHLKGFIGILTDDNFRSQLSEKEDAQCRQVINDALADLEEKIAAMHKSSENGDQGPLASVEVNSLLKSCVEAHQLIARKRKHTLKFKGTRDEVYVRVVKSQLKGVIDELLQNAIKFTQDGGEIVSRVHTEEGSVVLTIKDNGVGIPKDEQGKIFEKFYEIQNSNYHSSSKEQFMGGGLGLGLTSARTILCAHGGGIKVKSEVGVGSEFMAYLPVTHPDEPAN